jgi:hypothetical protein
MYFQYVGTIVMRLMIRSEEELILEINILLLLLLLFREEFLPSPFEFMWNVDSYIKGTGQIKV